MVLVILSIWGVDVLPALAGLGILGLVVGLGAQSLIKDLIAGFFIIFEHHFDVGDVVEINGFKGRVIDIGLKTTRVQNWKNDIKIFSNGNITESINYSLADSFAVIEFGISYGSDIQRTLELLEQELPKHMDKLPDLIDIPKVLGVTDLASSSVNIRVIAKTNPETQYAVERKLRQAIKELLDENGIEIPFPQVVVHEAKKK
jgi:small conductance mechanosensitive channel